MFQWDGTLTFNEYGESQNFGPDTNGTVFHVRRIFVAELHRHNPCVCDTLGERECQRHRIVSEKYWLVDSHGRAITAAMHEEAMIRAIVRSRMLREREPIEGIISSFDPSSLFSG